LFFCLFVHGVANASLLIAPTRVSLDERTRSTTVNLVNTSSKTATYRVHWVEQKQLPNGNYQELSKEEADKFPTASSMLRFSPRQVTLAPGERQTVRIIVRRRSGLKPGDYRSHMVFQKLPDPDELKDQPSDGSQIRVKVNLGFSIPVIVRKGKFDGHVKINKVDMLQLNNNGQKAYGLAMHVTRGGPYSVYGVMKAYWKDSNSAKYKQVAMLNNVAIYPELDSRIIYLGLSEFKQKKSGYLKLIYSGSEDLKAYQLDTYEARINAGDYKVITPEKLGK
ncbi:MAG: fimbria/pilus periplasmic chaperone, partial [Gammaproteobacteria bacterium]|nr:fimbria/pilus periplasmic chaperone [Gammaproteobacteria bacterium]